MPLNTLLSVLRRGGVRQSVSKCAGAGALIVSVIATPAAYAQLISVNYTLSGASANAAYTIGSGTASVETTGAGGIQTLTLEVPKTGLLFGQLTAGVNTVDQAFTALVPFSQPFSFSVDGGPDQAGVFDVPVSFFSTGVPGSGFTASQEGQTRTFAIAGGFLAITLDPFNASDPGQSAVENLTGSLLFTATAPTPTPTPTPPPVAEGPEPSSVALLAIPLTVALVRGAAARKTRRQCLTR